MNQRDQVLAMLKAAGPAGVHSFELLQAGLPRAAARVDELREAGFVIDSQPERLNGDARGYRYRLLDPPATPITTVSSPADTLVDAPLFAAPAPLDRQYGDAA